MTIENPTECIPGYLKLYDVLWRHMTTTGQVIMAKLRYMVP